MWSRLWRVLPLCAFLLSATLQLDRAHADALPVVLPFASTIAPLTEAPLPVYLPSWLPPVPSSVRATTSIFTTPNTRAPGGITVTYEANLVYTGQPTCSPCDLVTIRGSKDALPIDQGTKRIAIVPGIFAYLSKDTTGQWLSWRISRHSYALRCSLVETATGNVHPCSISQYLRIIRSVVWIN